MTANDAHEIPYSVRLDLIQLFVGNKLGEGSYRSVYEINTEFDGNPCVIKLENRAESFSNVLEWEIWRSCPPKWRKWLAPCYEISEAGSVLIQAKVKLTDRRPKKVPDFLDDVKEDNWGIFKNRLVMCDYGHHRFFAKGFENVKLKPIKDQWQT